MTQQTTRDGSQPEGQTITCGQTVNSRTTGSWLFSVDSRRDTGKDEGEKEDQPEPTAYTSLLTPLSDPQQPGAAFLLARRLWLSTCYTVGRGWGCLCICVPICPNLDLLLASCSDCRGLCVCVSVCVSVCVCVCVSVCLCVCVCAQSCSALFDPMDYSPPGSSDYGIFQARILKWVVLPFPPPRHLPDPPLLVSCIGRRVLYH